MLGKFYSNLHNSGGGIKYDLCNVYKSLLAALIIAITALAIIPVGAFAEPIEFTDSNGIKYTLTENADGETYTMTVSGSGYMEDYLFTDPLYKDYKNNITNIVIESGVKHIGQAAFKRCTALKSVTIPEGVEIIGDEAFNNCRSLTSIKFPSSLKSIGKNSFYQCSSLRSVEIPEGVEIIDNLAFVQCTSLTSVTLPSTVTTVGNRAFSGCTFLDNIIYQDGLSVDNAGIPNASTQVKYTVGDGKVTITEIILGEGKTAVTIPDRIGGKTVAEIDKDLMQKVAHTHTGGTATCTRKAVCALCGKVYGNLEEHSFTNYASNNDATCTADGTKTAKCDNCTETDTVTDVGSKKNHSYEDGKCTDCNTPDPNAGTTVTEPTVTDSDETDNTGSSSAETDPIVTDPTGSNPVVTAPPTPSRPSAPSYPSSPAVTAAAPETTTVTATTAEEIIADDTYTGEDVSSDAGIYEDDRDISERSAGLIVLAIAAVIVCAVLIKKVIF